MEFLQLAAKCSDSKKLDVNPKELYSDSEHSEDEEDNLPPFLHKGNVKLPDAPTSSIQDYFGSLRKLTKKSEKKPSSDVPVPTNESQTFRRVPGGSSGLQIGANTNVFYEGSHPPPPPVKINTPAPPEKRKHSITQSIQPPDVQAPKPVPVLPEKTSTKSPNQQSYKKLINHIHASNPNLVDVDFSLSKNFDCTLPKISKTNIWETNTKEMVTLKDLMLQQQEEESREMYNHRVHLGVEKKNSNPPRPEKPDNIINKQFNKIQARSLPKTPDYEMSFKPDDKEIQLARTKEGQILRDFGYEFIQGDEPSDQSKQFGSHRKHLHHAHQVYPLEKSNSNSSSRTGSFKKRGKFEVLKASSERILNTFNSTTLPSKKTHTSLAGTDGSQTMKKSVTYQDEFKDKKYEAQRKNSAPITVLSKLSFSSGDKHMDKKGNGKKFLGSPRFARAFFGKSSNHHHLHDDLHFQASSKEESDFYPINLPKVSLF